MADTTTKAGDLVGHLLYALDTAYRGAAEFLDYEAHLLLWRFVKTLH
jgi:hypothetical protein